MSRDLCRHGRILTGSSGRTEKKYDGTSGVAAFVGLWYVPYPLTQLLLKAPRIARTRFSNRPLT